MRTRRTSDHVNLSNLKRVRPSGSSRNYTEGSAALAGDESGRGFQTTSMRM